MRPRFGIGRIHDGFHAALFHSDVEAGSLYTQIIECLQQAPNVDRLPIFLSGIWCVLSTARLKTLLLISSASLLEH